MGCFFGKCDAGVLELLLKEYADKGDYRGFYDLVYNNVGVKASETSIRAVYNGVVDGELSAFEAITELTLLKRALTTHPLEG